MRKAAASLSLSSSLIEAVRSNDLLQVQQLVELQKKKGHFADVRDDVYGNTALHWACLHGHLGMVQYLTTTMGYNVESTTRDDGSTAVLVACRYGHLAIVQWLVQDDDDDDNDVKTGDEGSDTNASCCRVKANLKVKNKNGDSALHLACRSQNLALVQYLVERQHFDMYELNKQDESALGVAKRLSKGDILKSNRVLVTAFLLQRHGLVNRINEWVTYLLERPDLLYKIKDWCCKELEGAAVVFLYVLCV